MYRLVVIGVHTPEFAFERNVANVKRAITDLKINYPVAIDNDYTIWQAFENRYWPAHYFIDAQGHARYHHFGEGDYAESERVIQQLLEDAGRTDVASGVVSVKGSGAEAAADEHDLRSEETYVGSSRADNVASPEGMTQNTPPSRFSSWIRACRPARSLSAEMRIPPPTAALSSYRVGSGGCSRAYIAPLSLLW